MGNTIDEYLSESPWIVPAEGFKRYRTEWAYKGDASTECRKIIKSISKLLSIISDVPETKDNVLWALQRILENFHLDIGLTLSFASLSLSNIHKATDNEKQDAINKIAEILRSIKTEE